MSTMHKLMKEKAKLEGLPNPKEEIEA